jgi:hypothetical protein
MIQDDLDKKATKGAFADKVVRARLKLVNDMLD